MITDPSLQDSLAGLANVVGWMGACVLDRQGAVLAHRLPPPYEPVLVSGVMGQLGVALEMYSSLEPDATARVFVGRFEDGVLVVRWFDNYIVLVLGARALNTAMLMVALKAMSMKLGAAPQMPIRAPEISMPMAQSVPPNRPAPSSSMATLSLMPSSPGLSSGRSNPSPGSIPVETLREIATLLARSAGPLAQSVVKREIGKLGFDSRSLPKEQGPLLVDNCAQTVSDPAARRAFVAAARKLVG